MDAPHTTNDDDPERTSSQPDTNLLADEPGGKSEESPGENRGFQGTDEGEENDPAQLALDVATEQILSNEETPHNNSEPASEADNESMYSTGNVHDILQQLLNQTGSAGIAGGVGGGANTTPPSPQPPAPLIPMQPQIFQAQAPTSTTSSPVLGQNLVAQVMSSPQTLAALMPLFVQWLQLHAQPGPLLPPPQQQPQQQQYWPVMAQLLQQILTSSIQATPSQVNADAICRAFLQSYMYSQMQLQQSGGMLPPAFVSTVASSTALILPWFTAGMQPLVPGFNTAIPSGVQPVVAAAATTPGDNPQSAEAPAPKKRRRYNMEAFPQKLHRIITEAAANNNESIIRFTEDGTMFQILNADEFEKLLPGYFRHNSIASFKRLLHMYDFKRVQGTWKPLAIRVSVYARLRHRSSV
eukprot:scaffold286_cov169-Amphora_coffeaeformis.AAC.4